MVRSSPLSEFLQINSGTDLSRVVHDKDDIQSASLSPLSATSFPPSAVPHPTTPQTIEGHIPTATDGNINEFSNGHRPYVPQIPPATPSLDTCCNTQEAQSLSPRIADNSFNTNSTDPSQAHVSASKSGPSTGSQEPGSLSTNTMQGELYKLELDRGEHIGAALDTSNMLAGLSVAPSYVIDPSTITFSRNISNSFMLDTFFDIDLFDLDIRMEVDQSQSPAKGHKRKISVESNFESDLTESPAGSPKPKPNNVDESESEDTESPAGSPKPNNDVESEPESDLNERPAGNHKPDSDNVESESESADTGSPRGSRWRKINDAEGGDTFVNFGAPNGSRKRKIDDVDTESESEEEIEKVAGQASTGTLK